MRVCLLGLLYAFRWGFTGIQKQHYCSHEIDFFSFPKIGGDISPKEHPELKSYVHHLCVIDSQQALFALSHRIEPRVWALLTPRHPRITAPGATGMAAPSTLLSWEKRSCWVLSAYHKTSTGKPARACSRRDVSCPRCGEAAVGRRRQKLSRNGEVWFLRITLLNQSNFHFETRQRQDERPSLVIRWPDISVRACVSLGGVLLCLEVDDCF